MLTKKLVWWRCRLGMDWKQVNEAHKAKARALSPAEKMSLFPFFIQPYERLECLKLRNGLETR